MSRIGATFERLTAEGRKALVTFTMAGDPDADTSLEILFGLADHADILEIGMPFSDPMADGPVIQAAGLRALNNGMDINGVLRIVQRFRSKNSVTPIVLMGYLNPVLKFGAAKFASRCKEIGIDGLIIVDIPPEEAAELGPELQQNGIDLIRLVTPTTGEDRLRTILEDASGFLYYVSITGVTGTASADPEKVSMHIEGIKAMTALPVVVGFGIRTPADAATMARIADGVVVGSALVQTISENQNQPGLAARVSAQAQALATAIGRSR